MFKSIMVTLVAAAVLGMGQARAETYTTRDAYLAATTGNTTLDFETPNVGRGAEALGSSYTSGGVTFAQTDRRLLIISPSLFILIPGSISITTLVPQHSRQHSQRRLMDLPWT